MCLGLLPTAQTTTATLLSVKLRTGNENGHKTKSSNLVGEHIYSVTSDTGGLVNSISFAQTEAIRASRTDRGTASAHSGQLWLQGKRETHSPVVPMPYEQQKQ